MVKAIVLALALSLPARVFAANAHELFGSGIKALGAGRPDEALSAFEAAYQQQPAPSLFFWIAEAHRALGRKASAARFYRRYLAELPGGPKAAEAKARLTEFKGERHASKKRSTTNLEELVLEPPKESSKRAAAQSPPAASPAPPPMNLPLPAKPAASAKAGPALAAPAPAPVAKAAPAPAPPVTPAPVAPPSPAPVAKAAPAPAPPPTPAPVAPPAPAPVSKAAPAVKPALASPIATTSALAPDTQSRTFFYLQYVARLLAPNGSFMATYATPTSPGAAGAIFTHGLALGRQTENFKNAVYLGFGTQDGGAFAGGKDTLLRYELSWQSIWAPLGATQTLSPHVGFRLGGMGVKSERLTGGSLKPGVALAALAGIDLQLVHAFVLTAGMGYDANLGPDLGPNASISGFALDLGATARF